MASDEGGYGRLFPVARAVLAPTIRFAWRIHTDGLDNLPADGPAILCPNHTSVLDSFLLPVALLPVSGDLSARHVARWQPAKLAAMEGQFRTETGAPLRIGGWPDEATGQTRYALEIPRALSLLAFHDPHAEVKGLDAFPRADWPPVAPVHVSFQVMVGLGSFMALLAIISLVLMARRRELDAHRWLLRALVAATPMGFICVEAGWTVTEVGRQPWIIQGVLRTADAVTPMPGLVVPFVAFTLLYCALGLIVAWLLHQQVFRSAIPAATDTPRGTVAGRPR